MLEVASRKIRQRSAFPSNAFLRDPYIRREPASPTPFRPRTYYSAWLFFLALSWDVITKVWFAAGVLLARCGASTRLIVYQMRQRINILIKIKVKSNETKCVNYMQRGHWLCLISLLVSQSAVHCTPRLAGTAGRWIWKNWVGDSCGVVPVLAGAEC